MLQNNQKGFTLLELLVVITLLATLSVGALVAYEGIGENASNVAAANNIKVADSSIRAYRAIENVYPNQWDNLANLTGAPDATVTTGTVGVLANNTRNFFGQWTVPATTDAVWIAAASALNRVGINELQTLTAAATIDLAVTSPNQALNESSQGVSVAADELEFDVDGTTEYAGGAVTTFNISTVPSSNGTACAAGTADLTRNLNGGVETVSAKLNRINDNLDDDGCHLVVALGFGKDVPGTTLDSRVAISTAPTYTNGTIVNPSIHYARYVALFHLGSSAEDPVTGNALPTITAADILPTPRLLAVVDTEGRNIDQSIAGAFASN